MLTALGVLTIIALLAAILSQKTSPLVALVLIPVVAALAGGFGLKTGAFIVNSFIEGPTQKIFPLAWNAFAYVPIFGKWRTRMTALDSRQGC